MKQEELQALAEKAGFDWGSLGFRDRLCFMNLAALVEQKTVQDVAANCAQRGVNLSAGVLVEAAK